MPILVYNVGMFVATIPNRNSKPTILLRESYREGGKVKTRTIANLTKWPPERIAAMERLCKGEFDGWAGGEVTSGEIFGVLFALKHLADQVGITRALGPSAEGRLGLFLVLARIAHGGSRLSAVRWGWANSTRTTCMPRWTGWQASRSASSGNCTKTMSSGTASRRRWCCTT